jgi:uncharacterized phage protein gp47/JayE
VPLARPSLGELVDRVRADLRGELEILGPLLRRAMVDVVGAVVAGTTHSLYGWLEWLARQLFGDKAEREFLLRKAAMYGITPTPATFATGNVTATGTNGTAIPVDTILRLDEVIAYRVTTGQVIAGGTATLPVVALLAGDDSNLPATAALTFETPIPNVSSDAVVAVGGIDGGVDEEGTEELRARYLLRLREPPQGGADQDYEAWALKAPGMTRAWVYPHELGKGTVVVRTVMDGEPDIFPDAGEVATVQAELQAERPITAEVTALAPVELELDFTIEVVPDNAETRAAVEAELEDLLQRVAEPGDGVARGKVLLSQIRTAIGISAGVTDYTLTDPPADVVPGVGELLVVGTITWV